jgi:hypothetical protein
LLIEAKGGTSSKDHTPRYTQPFDSGPVRKHVSVAFYYAVKLAAMHPADKVAIALLGDAKHRAEVAAIETALVKLAICLFFVDESGAVSTA